MIASPFNYGLYFATYEPFKVNPVCSYISLIDLRVLNHICCGLPSASARDVHASKWSDAGMLEEGADRRRCSMRMHAASRCSMQHANAARAWNAQEGGQSRGRMQCGGCWRRRHTATATAIPARNTATVTATLQQRRRRPLEMLAAMHGGRLQSCCRAPPRCPLSKFEDKTQYRSSRTGVKTRPRYSRGEREHTR